jgi:3-oxoacyl-[acyl-carrier-protein] synthase II
MTRRRVVVTGLGCISPVGNTVAESWANLLAGKSGIDLITQFDAGAFACKFAGEVKGFNIVDYIPEKEARHMDRFIHLGLAAAMQAVADSGLAHRVTRWRARGYSHRLQHRCRYWWLAHD